MLEATGVLLALLFGLLMLEFLKLRRAAAHLPPGPTPLPIIGNLWALKFQLHPEILMQLSRTYGNIMTVWAGQTPMVVLSGYNAVRDAFISHSKEFADRLITPSFQLFVGENGIAISNGHMWKEQRCFGLKILRKLGQEKEGLDWRIQVEAQSLVGMISANQGRPLDLRRYLTLTVNNVISAVILGHRFPLEDELFQQLMESTDYLISLFGTNWRKAYDAFPWLMKHLPGPHQKVTAHITFLRNFMMQEILNHQKNLTGKPYDFIDFYLKQIHKTKDDPSSPFRESNLAQVLAEFFLAGSETTITTLLWALLYLVANPDVQETVHRELDKTFKSSQVILFEDRKRLPYTNAVIHEIQRCANIGPFGLPRQCVQDTQVQGIKLKKGTIVFANLASVLNDPNHWDTPTRFNPRHFLDKDGKFQSNAAFLPFSA
ncbi:hypothetical protein FKM82_021276, partial [Ascaphus truei]